MHHFMYEIENLHEIKLPDKNQQFRLQKKQMMGG